MTRRVPTRERILKSARHLFQQRGYHAVGTAEILKIARAPKGSMYHHFPGGKEQIAIEAVREISKDIQVLFDRLESNDESLASALRRMARAMASWLKKSAWREGTMLTTTAVGAVPELPAIHAAIKAALDGWRERLVLRLRSEGASTQAAYKKSLVIVAAIEGAMILARIAQDESIVIDVIGSVASSLETRR